jgi:hypothetical protein
MVFAIVQRRVALAGDADRERAAASSARSVRASSTSIRCTGVIAGMHQPLPTDLTTKCAMNLANASRS